MESPLSDSPAISIVVPVYNEEGSVLSLSQRIRNVCESLGTLYEVVFVDDGSRDRTFDILEELNRQDAPNLLKSVEQRMTQGLLDMEYEDALRDFFKATSVGVEKIGGLPWTEIDFPEDVLHAQNDVLPKLPEHDRD